MDPRLGLEDADLWSDPFRTADAAAAEAEAERFTGLHLVAPSRVPLDRDPALPVVVLERGTYAELAAGDFASHGVVVAVEQGSGAAFAGPSRLIDNLVPPPDDEDDLRPDDAATTLPRGTRSRLFRLDLCALAEVPWRPGRYLVWALRGAERSRSAETTLEPPPGRFRDPEVERFIERQRLEDGHDLPFPEPTRSGAAPAAAPPVPSLPGIVLALEPRVSLRVPGASRWMLGGSFRLPVRPQEVVSKPFPTGGYPLPVAVVRLALVVTGQSAPFPTLLPLAVACFEPLIQAADGARFATGTFALDLSSVRAIGARPGRYFVHAFAGAHTATPVESVLV